MRIVRAVLFYVLLLAVWQVLAVSGVWNSTLFPGPIEVGGTLWDLICSGKLIDATSISLRRVLAGYAIALVLGVPLGVFLARSRVARETVGTLVIGLQALPSICWLPLALLWYGLNDRAILFVVVMGSLMSITITVKDGVMNLPQPMLGPHRRWGPHLFDFIRTFSCPLLFRASSPERSSVGPMRGEP